MPAGVCSAAPSAWAPRCRCLCLQEQRGNEAGSGRAGVAPGWHSPCSFWGGDVPGTCLGHSGATGSPGPWHLIPHPLALRQSWYSLLGCRSWGCQGSCPPRPTMPTCLPMQGRCRGAGAWIWCGIFQVQLVKPLGCGGAQAPGQHREDAERVEEVLGAAGPHAATPGPGCPGWGCLPHSARPCRLLPVPGHSSRCYHNGLRTARHAPCPPWHPLPMGRIQRGLSTKSPSAPLARGEEDSRELQGREPGPGGGLGRRCCLEMGSKTSEEGRGGRGWLRTSGIGCGESSLVLPGVCPARGAWHREGTEPATARELPGVCSG